LSDIFSHVFLKHCASYGLRPTSGGVARCRRWEWWWQLAPPNKNPGYAPVLQHSLQTSHIAGIFPLSGFTYGQHLVCHSVILSISVFSFCLHCL